MQKEIEIEKTISELTIP